eukprot:7500643-Pyramimonas_sp.AAC.1
MEDSQAVCKVIKAGGSMTLMHLLRARRIDAAAISEQFTRGVVILQHERIRNEPPISVQNKRFTDLHAWVKVLYLVNIVALDLEGQPVPGPSNIDVH